VKALDHANPSGLTAFAVSVPVFISQAVAYVTDHPHHAGISHVQSSLRNLVVPHNNLGSSQ